MAAFFGNNFARVNNCWIVCLISIEDGFRVEMVLLIKLIHLFQHLKTNWIFFFNLQLTKKYLVVKPIYNHFV